MIFIHNLSRHLLFASVLLRCFGTNGPIVCHAARPDNTMESTTTSTLYRVASGLKMGIEGLSDLVIPSNEPITATNIQVYFVGLGRTGTTSIASAMTMLKYKTLHDDESANVFDLYGDYNAGTIDEDELHAKIGQRGFNCSFMYNGYDWAGKQENVKVILTKRDPEKWADSWLTVADLVDVMAKPPFIWLESIRRFMPTLVQMHKDIPSGGHPNMYLDRDTLIKGYEVHANAVRNAVPKERLLEYSVKEGWGPLCRFLGVEEPDVEFPHINDRVKIRAAASVIRLVTFIWPLFVILPLLFVWRCLFPRNRDASKAKDE